MKFYKRQKDNAIPVRQFSEMAVSREGGYPKSQFGCSSPHRRVHF